VRSLDDYLALVTPFWANKPKFIAELSLLLQCLADTQQFVSQLPTDFDIDVAIGAQLDVVGEWVGRSRRIVIPLENLYFSFDIDGLGFDQAVWEGPYSPPTAIDSLDDSTYRSLLYAKIAANHYDGTIASLEAIYNAFFNNSEISHPGTYLYIEDKYDMSYVVGVAGQLPNTLYLAILTQGLIPTKPEGVMVFYAVTSVNGEPNFGFDVENNYIKGFDEGSWALLS
jgi:hypothetical protein